MGLLLDSTRKVFGSKPPELPPAVPFEITCACGLQLNGVRLDQRQFVPCPQCGQVLFVMPLSLYPAPRPMSGSPRPTAGHVARAVVKPRRRKRPLGVRVRIRMRRARRRTVRGLCRLVPPARWFSRGRLLSYAIVILIVGTAVFTVDQSRRSRLPSEILSARAQWTAALEVGNFREAREALDRATRALRRTGKQQPEIEHLAAEVALFDDLIQTLDDSPQQWADRLTGKPGGPALAFDLVLTPTLQEDGTVAGYTVRSRLVLGDQYVRLDVSGLELVARLRPAQAQRVLFGARLAAIEPGLENGEWVVRFHPASGVLLTSDLCLEKAGWPLDESARDKLRKQKTWVSEQ